MQARVPDAVYEKARKSFPQEELVNLTLAITTINGWNRLAIAFRMVRGEYQPGQNDPSYRPNKSSPGQ